jgi:tetratricopeptide (TPR) repeat protein
LCRERGTLTPKEMARRLLARENTIGSQVHKLVENGYLASMKRRRETYYELSEPLMRLTFEVKEQSLLVILIDFLRIWYRPDELLQMRDAALSPSTCRYIEAAIDQSLTKADPKLDVLEREISLAEAEGRQDDLGPAWEEKATLTKLASDWLKAGYYYERHLSDPVAAIRCYDLAIDIGPEDATTWNNKGNCLRNLGRHQESLDCYDRALLHQPDYSAAWNGKGIALRLLGKHELALVCVEHALSSDHKSHEAWCCMGTILGHMGRFDAALKCFDRAIELDSKYIHAWNNKGYTLHTMGRHQDSISCYDRTLEINPLYHVAWNNKGFALYVLGRVEEGLACYERAVEHEPRKSLAHLNKGIALGELGRHEEALVCFDQAIALSPEQATPWYNRAEALLATSRWQTGFDSIHRAFQCVRPESDYLGDVRMIWKSIFRTSIDDGQLRSHVSTLVDLYAEAQSHGKQALRATIADPLAYLADGLVRSLAKIDSERVTSNVLESYVAAVEARVKGLPEFDVALRLFRYGIRYLISRDEAEFVELIRPERRILRQALGLEEPQEE